MPRLSRIPSSPAAGSRPPLDRRTRIVRLVAGAGFMSVDDIASATGVSAITVRRDLAALEVEEALRRTHGGAVPLRPQQGLEPLDLIEPAFEARRKRNMSAKEAIALAAAQLIAPGETIALDVGTTALAFAGVLPARTGIKVVTNNLRAAGLLADRDIEVYVPGGRVRGHEHAVGGARAVAEISDHWFHTAVIGVSGVSGDGVFDYSPEDTELKRAYISRASRVIVLADRSKFARRALVKVAPLRRITMIVADRAPSRSLADALAAAGVGLLTPS